MSQYMSIPIEYLAQLSNERKKAAFVDYNIDIFRGNDRSFNEYAMLWTCSKQTSFAWITEFKSALRNHHNYWSNRNENQGKKPEKVPNAKSNAKSNEQTPISSDFKAPQSNGSQTANQTLLLYKRNINNIVEFFNSQLGSKFKADSKTTEQLITKLLKDGFELKDFYAVISYKVTEWKNDIKMSKYLTPSTLFAYANFEKYLQQVQTSETKSEVGVKGWAS